MQYIFTSIAIIRDGNAQSCYSSNPLPHLIEMKNCWLYYREWLNSKLKHTEKVREENYYCLTCTHTTYTHMQNTVPVSQGK